MRCFRHQLLTSLPVLLLPVSAYGESTVQHLLESKLHDRIKAYDDRLPGVLGVATIDLTSGRIFVYNGEAVFPTASSIKIPIMAAMYRARLNFDERVTLQPAEAVGGSGTIQNDLKNGPVTLTLRDLMTAMIIGSDNTATNRCISTVGMDRVNRMLTEFGFRSTRLRRIMMDSGAAARGDENTATPLEMARIVEMLYRNRLASPPESRQMLDLLKRVRADMRAAIPARIEVASKPGDLTGVHCEAGLVYLPGRPFVMTVFSTFLDEKVNPVQDITRMVFDFFQKLAESNEYGNKVK